MRREKVMVLAGSSWQIPLIKKIKEKGYEVLDINPYENSPAFEYADEYRLLDILDRDACLKCAEDEQVDAIMSEQCDIANPSVAYISEKMGLISMGCDYAELYTNKLKMREFCQKQGLNCPEFKICYTLQEAVEFYKNLGKKIIIKPLDSNSSRGVFSINSEDELCEHFEEALSFSRVEKAVLCERYINGKEFTIDGIKTDDGHVSLAISEKYHYEHNPNIACTLFFSHENPNFDYSLLREENDKYVNLTGLPFGLTHAEYKYEDGKFYLIEIGARGGGNLIGSDIVPLMSGVDNYSYLIEKTLGHPVNESYKVDEKLWERCAVLHFFDAPGNAGEVKEIKGIDFLENNAKIIKYNLNFKVGDVIKKAENDSARIGYYIAYADSREELQELMREIDSTFAIEVSNTQEKQLDYSIKQVFTKEEKEQVLRVCDSSMFEPISKNPNYLQIVEKVVSAAEVVVAYNEDILGFVALYANNSQTKEAYISMFVVRDEYQGLHIGSALMEYSVHVAKAHGMNKVKLEVSKRNKKAISLYKKKGFTILADETEKSFFMMLEIE